MSNVSTEVSHRVLEAAQILFARHGFARTSMADVATEAGVARATLYLRFADKRALFHALADLLVTSALRAAEGAWRDEADLADNLEATVLAKDLPLHRLLHATPYGAALLAVDADLTMHHARRLQDGFLGLLTERARQAEARGAGLEMFGGADGFADFLATACAGLKHEIRAESPYRAAIRRLCAVTACAALGTQRAPPPSVTML